MGQSAVDGAPSTVALRAALSGPFQTAIIRVKDAFQGQGFGVLSEIDVQKALREKTGKEIEPYTILGMCNPSLASQAIAAEHEIGVFLPCNVLVHECGAKVQVRAQDPEVLFRAIGNDALQPIAQEVRGRIERAIDALGAS